jgi:hypothetical protein
MPAHRTHSSVPSRVSKITADYPGPDHARAFGHGCIGQLPAVRDAKRVASTRPWWQTTRTVRQGYWMAGIFLLVGAGQLVTFPDGGAASKWLQLGTGVLGILLGTGYLMTAIALRRDQRRISRRWR